MSIVLTRLRENDTVHYFKTETERNKVEISDLAYIYIFGFHRMSIHTQEKLLVFSLRILVKIH